MAVSLCRPDELIGHRWLDHSPAPLPSAEVGVVLKVPAFSSQGWSLRQEQPPSIGYQGPHLESPH